jgi:hypothetical protein
MKKQNFKKLALDRETLVPLQANDLGDVNGGTGGLIRSAVEVSKRACTLITTIASTPAVTCKGQ